jgi:hypothetical protein
MVGCRRFPDDQLADLYYTLLPIFACLNDSTETMEPVLRGMPPARLLIKR